jgi:RNA 2',3'-cyclic 3'-phosphodiesterase
MSARRSFVAIELPPLVVAALLRAGKSIRLAATHWRDDKWVSEHNLHITLKFLGTVEDNVLQALQADLGPALANVAIFPLALERTLAVPHHGHRNMIWATFADPDSQCATLASIVDEVAARHGIERDTRPFVPHVTLVRARKPRRLTDEALASANAEILAHHVSMSVSSATLLASTLTPAGPIYERLHKWTFSPRR